MITLRVGFSESNANEKYAESVERLAKAMGVPVTVKPRKHDDRGERWPFEAMRQVVEYHQSTLPAVLDEVYRSLTKHLGLPYVTQFRKAKDDTAPLVFRGRALYDARTGKALTHGEFRKILQTIERFLNRSLRGQEERIVMDAVAVGKLLNRMLLYNTAEALQTLGLEKLNYGGTTFTELSAAPKRIEQLFGMSGEEKSRYEAVKAIAGDHITGINNAVQSDIRRTLMRGVVHRHSNSQVAQDLLEAFGGQNRDWHRVVETEMADVANNAALHDMMNEASDGPVYVERVERLDTRTCNFCRKATERKIIALVVPAALDNDQISDPHASIAIWPGKSNYGRAQKDWWWPAGPVHPFCRGSWVSHTAIAEDDALGQYTRQLSGELKERSKAWGEAVDQAEAEYRAKGFKKLDENTPGYMNRIRQLFKESGHDS